MARNLENLIPTRRSLLSRLKNREDQESWQDFFDTYWKLIYDVAMKAGLRDAEAQEVVQETVIAVSKKINEFKYDPEIGSFKNWLLHTARWRISDQFRNRLRGGAKGGDRRENHTGTSTIERIPDPAGVNLDAVWNAEWAKHIWDKAIERVKPQVRPKHYQIFDLYFIKQWPVQKVARTLDVSLGQVYLTKHRISALIKREIKNLESAVF
jgi:RNA polymerase sigma factor (sigma-70 family)